MILWMTGICYISATPWKMQIGKWTVIWDIAEWKNKTIQIFNFKGSQEEVDNLYKESKIDKLKSICDNS